MMQTVVITPEAYDEALAFCNARRKYLGIEGELTELPPGRVGDPTSCPCANTCNGRIGVGYIYWSFTNDPFKDGFTSEHPTEFVRQFDKAGIGEFLPIRGK